MIIITKYTLLHGGKVIVDRVISGRDTEKFLFRYTTCYRDGLTDSFACETITPQSIYTTALIPRTYILRTRWVIINIAGRVVLRNLNKPEGEASVRRWCCRVRKILQNKRSPSSRFSRTAQCLSAATVASAASPADVCSSIIREQTTNQYNKEMNPIKNAWLLSPTIVRNFACSPIPKPLYAYVRC